MARESERRCVPTRRSYASGDPCVCKHVETSNEDRSRIRSEIAAANVRPIADRRLFRLRLTWHEHVSLVVGPEPDRGDSHRYQRPHDANPLERNLPSDLDVRRRILPRSQMDSNGRAHRIDTFEFVGIGSRRVACDEPDTRRRICRHVIQVNGAIFCYGTKVRGHPHRSEGVVGIRTSIARHAPRTSGTFRSLESSSRRTGPPTPGIDESRERRQACLRPIPCCLQIEAVSG